MIEVHNLKMKFEEKLILNIDSFEFASSTIHGVVGLNGAGKTTFFNLLAKYLKPSQGQFLLKGNRINRTEIGYLETVNYFYSNITGKEYLNMFPGSNQHFNLNALNSLFHLPLNEVIETYSTGMKKKLALLAILKQDKEIYIFDEPFNGLDLETNKSLEYIIEILRSRNKTVFISSHILHPLTLVCDYIHLLKSGHFSYSFDKSQFDDIDRKIFAEYSVLANDVLSKSV